MASFPHWHEYGACRASIQLCAVCSSHFSFFSLSTIDDTRIRVEDSAHLRKLTRVPHHTPMKLYEASRTPPSLRRALQGSVDGTSTSANDSVLLIVGSLVLALTVLFYFSFVWFSKKRTSSKGDLESVDHDNGIQTPETDDSGWLSTSIDGNDTPGSRADPKEHRRLPPDKKRIIIEPTKSAEGALQRTR